MTTTTPATLLLRQSEVRAVLSMEDAIEGVEGAFAAHARGETLMPVKVHLDLRSYNGDFRAMPAYLDGATGVKWINAHPDNPAKGLPTVRGMYILSDPATAVPLAVLDATWLTAARTGAAAAVASHHLAPANVGSIGFIGCGVQARTLLAAHRAVFDSFEVVAADARSEAAAAFAEEAGGRAGSLADASACDIVCTATPVREPIIRSEWLNGPRHVNAMRADGHGKQEFATEILGRARLVVDDYDQAIAGGEINGPIERGEFTPDTIHASLGEIIDGLRPGREGDELTIFDSTGLAVQDVAIAARVYNRARDSGIGTELDFFA
ncbi:MAG: ornithine cyclodeaminase family protein [Acidobacteriota bacterium]|nr:ornithine cyclodeaminase family protein [Acidobacteriota bacterium]